MRRHLRSDAQVPRPESDSVWALIRNVARFAVVCVGLRCAHAAFTEKPLELGVWIGTGVAVGLLGATMVWRVRPARRSTATRAGEAD